MICLGKRRVDRMYDEADDRICLRCGECCMALTLCIIDEDEADRLGREFCYRTADGEWGIRRVERDWAPAWAKDGVCIFLYPDRDGFRCMARDERPKMCSEFKCTDPYWAAKLDFRIAEDKADDEWMLLSEGERWALQLELEHRKEIYLHHQDWYEKRGFKIA